ncbi:biotin synthase [Helicobacter sp. MIT 14-3879]|uniref:biotin synthase n=1 Tax=Helicobacter sp. MIT 14-3879 TaxID=2040649 RepID=UPI000E1F3E8B|nr:biotin synthase [Helicobacter sp. MIT 14-3879]RDU65564.1 biotin synthase [Helicobacter sp. MIT 14-3879]
MAKKIYLCSISNVSSGACKEDCVYCTQSIKYGKNSEIYKNKPKEVVLKETISLAKFGASGFCLVTSGLGLDSAKCEYIASLASDIKRKLPNMLLIACCGIATKESLKYLKQNGIDSYNHNLETAKSNFKNICTTHSFEDRLNTCENVLSIGLKLCSGGIFGLGESRKQRIELLKTIKSLNPHSSPINFYIPNPALPLEPKIMDRNEALECIILAREFLRNSILMLAGGREVVFGKEQKDIFENGIDAIVLGNYLTTNGDLPLRDLEMLKNYNLKIGNLISDRKCAV